MAMVIPIQGITTRGRGPAALVVILTKDNWERMRDGDPFDMRVEQYGTGTFDLDQPLRNLDLIIAYEEDAPLSHRLAQEQGLAGVMAHLERRRIHRHGDMAPPVSVKPKRRPS